MERTSLVATSRELLDALDDPTGHPLVCVDLDAAVAATAPRPDPGRPMVVLGVSVDATRAVPEWVDVALTGADSPPRPWIHATPGGADLVNLVAAIRRHPQASVMAAQVMRMSSSLDPAHALFEESLAYGLLQSGPEYGEWLRGQSRQRSHHDASDGPDVLIERRGDELFLTLHRSNRRNAYRAKTRDELVEGLTLALIDSSIVTVHLRGDGLSFSSGGDLTEFGTVADGPSGHIIRSVHSAVRMLSDLGDRSVADVHGPCIGAGVELSAACGTVRAAPDTTFALPEVGMGLIPGAGGTWSVPARVGRRRATWLALTGTTLPAADALAWGLVDEIVDPLTQEGA